MKTTWELMIGMKFRGRNMVTDLMKTISIYVSNLLETFSAKDLFHACNKYIRDLKRDDRHLGRFKAFNVRPMNGNKGTRTESFVWTAIEGLPMCAWNNEALSKIVSPWGTLAPVDLVEDNSLPYRKVCVATIVSTIINNRIKIIVKGKVYWTRIRELEPLSPEFDDEFCESSSDDESVGEEKNSPSMDDVPDHVTESSFMNENSKNVINGQESPQDKSSEDPFGYSFTWSIKSAKKMSKLDRLIIMREVVADYGPSPFRVYQSWFYKKGFDNLIKDSWCSSSFNHSNKIIPLKKKLQALKASIKEWCKDDIKRSNDTCFSIKARNEELVAERISLLKELHNLNKCHSLGMAQKAKVRWAIEGDENSKYFHGIINKKRSQLAIHGVITDGEWIDEPCKVKNEFLKHLANQFECPSGPCIDIDSDMFKKLSTEQVAD
nr:RNA-directed DNA polymerase, eukaryota [Tanacetum cinerariifolium]